MPIPELPIQVQIANLEVDLTNIMIAHVAIPKLPPGRDLGLSKGDGRNWETDRKRAALHRQWDEKYDQLIALRLRAYAEGIELAPILGAKTEV